uniref:RdRp n=1 Tax=viral metagenome TaxID=1070528 RepID=A0A2V0RBT0_9ZZZZ
MFNLDYDEVIVDEAGACSIVELVALCNKPNLTLHLFGDINQITTTDFSTTPGLREDLNVLNYHSDKLEIMNESRRYGEPYASNILCELYPNLSVHEDVTWNTTYELIKSYEIDDVLKHLNTNNFDMIVTFHNETYNLLLDTYTGSGKIVKVHADQGAEGDRVAVIYWSPDGSVSPRGILGNIKYITTALTRCRKHIALITNMAIENFNEVIGLSKCGKGDVQFLNPDTLTIDNPLDDASIKLLTEVVKNVLPDCTLEFNGDQEITFLGAVKNVSINVTFSHCQPIGNDTKSKVLLMTGKSYFTLAFNKINKECSKILSMLMEHTTRVSIETTNMKDNSDINAFICIENGTATGTIDDLTNNETESFYTTRSVATNSWSIEHDMNIATHIPMVINVDNTKNRSLPTSLSDFMSNAPPMLQSYKLVKLMWKRLICMADVCLINQKNNGTLKLKTPMGNLKVKIFDGCSLFCGFKFTFENGNNVIVSSAHTENTEDIVTVLSCQVRSFMGSRSDINCIVKFLNDPLPIYLPCNFNKNLLSRMFERIRTVSHARLSQCGIANGAQDAGIAYESLNTVVYDNFEREHQPQARITHQRVTKLLYTVSNDTYLYPDKTLVTSINDVMSLMRGINATESNISVKNVKKMDTIIARKMIALETERKIVTMPKSLWNRWNFMVSDNIHDKNVIKTNSNGFDDTIACMFDAINMVYMKKVLKLNCVDVKWVDSSILHLNMLENYRILDSDLENHEKLYLSNKLTKLIESLSQTAGMAKVDKQRNVDKCEQLKTNGAFMRSGKLSNTLYASINGITKIDVDAYENIYALIIDFSHEYMATENRNVFMKGNKFRQYNMDECVKKYNWATIHTIGIFKLVKLIGITDVQVVWPKQINMLQRSFSISGISGKLFSFPNAIFKKCMSRATVPGTGVDDMLAYLRSVSSTVVYTSAGNYNRFKIDLDDMHMLSLIVVNIAKAHKKYFDTMHSFLHTTETNVLHDLMDIGIGAAKTHVINWLNNSGVVDLLNAYTDWLTENEDGVLARLTAMFKDAHVEEVQLYPKFVQNKYVCNNKTVSFTGTLNDGANDYSNNNDTQCGKNAGASKSSVTNNNDSKIPENADSTNWPSTLSDIWDDVYKNRATPTSKSSPQDSMNNDNRHGSAVTIQRCMRNHFVKVNGVHNIGCITCPVMEKKQLIKINNALRYMFFEVIKVLREYKLDFTLARGTVLAAMYYGRMVYFNKYGFKHWVDGDVDIIVYTHDDSLMKIVFNKLAKVFMCKQMQRSNGRICAFLKYGLYGDVNMERCPDVHPHHAKRNKIMSHTCIDIAFVKCDNDFIHIDHKDMSEQFGLPMGRYDASKLWPTYDMGIKLYGIDILMPKQWWATLSYTANIYKDGNYAALRYPWYPGIETAGSARCKSYAYKGEYDIQRNWLPKFELLQMYDNSVMHKMFGFKQDTALMPICRLRCTVAIVMGGSMGDTQPLLSIMEVLNGFCELTIFKPEDVQLPECYNNCNVIQYAKSYKGMVHGCKSTSGVIAIVTDSLKNIKGTFDYTVSMHFTRERYMLKCNIKHVIFHPLLVPVDGIIFKASQKLTSVLLHSGSTEEHYNCVLKDINKTEYKNVGYPINSTTFEINEATDKYLQLYHQNSAKFTLITLGSMGNAQFETILQRIMLTIDTPILIVRGNNMQHLRLKTKCGATYSGEKDRYNPMLTVVKYINYNVITQTINEVYCHGGAGTVQVFYANNVRVHFYPQAYDQQSNKLWYDKQKPYKHFDANIEWNYFRKNVGKIFGATMQERKYNDTSKKLYTGHPHINPQALLLQVYTQKATVNCLCKVITSSDCVLIAAMKCLGEGTMVFERFKEIYVAYTNQRTVNNVEDVMYLIIGSRVPLNVYDMTTSCLYTVKINGKTNKHCMIINNEHTHMSFGESSDETIINFQDGPTFMKCWNMKLTMPFNEVTREMYNVLNRGVCKTQLLDPDVVSTIKASLRADLKSKILTIMRTKDTLYLLTGVAHEGYYSCNENYTHWATYVCFGNYGMVNCIYLKCQTTDGGVMYHGHKLLHKLTLCVKIHNTSLSRTLRKNYENVKDANVVAINQTTKTYCESNGIAVQFVSKENALKLYIHNTWNRKHHKEREQHCIRTARVIYMGTRKCTEYEVALLKKKYGVRIIVLKSIMYMCIEPSNEADGVHIRNWLQRQTMFKKYETTELWISDKLQIVELMDSLVKANDYGMHILRQQSLSLERTLTLNDILTKCHIDPMGTVISAFIKQMGRDNLGANELMLELDEVTKFDKGPWKMVDAQEVHLDYPYVFVKDKLLCYGIIEYGYGIDMDKAATEFWNDKPIKYRSKVDDKFGIVTEQNSVLTTLSRQVIANVTAFSTMPDENALAAFEHAPELLTDNKVFEFVESNNGQFGINVTPIDEVASAKTQDYWQLLPYLRDPIAIMPTLKNFKVKSRLQPGQLAIKRKIRMEMYPAYARPSMASEVFETMNSVTNRQGSVKMYQKHVGSAKLEFEMFKTNYFRDDWETLVASWKQNPLTINYEDSYKWAKEHSYPKMVMKSLDDLLRDGFEMNPINAIKVHGKVEQTTRLTKLSRWMTEVTTRSILASSYCISALFCPLFKQCKARFKEILRPKIVYTDGMSPIHMNTHAKTVDTFDWVIEDDLSKQDAATTHLIIDTEMMIYELLGVDPADLEMYSWMHMNWRFKGNSMSGVWDAMRLSGQPTTSLGNAITNLILHNRFMIRNSQHIVIMYLLGDDNIIGATKQLNVKRHGTETQDIYNIVSKITQQRYVGEFTWLLMHTIDDQVQFCPNFKRLRQKFGVCSYAFTEEERSEKLEMRKLSYALMAGAFANSTKICNKFGVRCPDWFDIPSAIEANKIYHETTTEDVHNDIAMLFGLMDCDSIQYEHAEWQNDRTAINRQVNLSNLENKFD